MARTDPEERRAAEARKLALTLVATMGLWLGAQYLGAAMGWDGRIALAFDFAALAAFTWTLVGTYRIWRQRRGN